VKRLLVEEAGGKCVVCGYDEHPAALQFHHLDPSRKEFQLSARGLTRGIDRARAEASKCVLLCANCHALVEIGVKELPSSGR
jgi:hypothetical protein